MKFYRKYLLLFLMTGIFFSMHHSSLAQSDTTINNKEDSTREKRKTFLDKMFNNLKRDTVEVDRTKELLRNEDAFKPYEGSIIRNIFIKRLPFGSSIADTSRKFISGLTSLANDLHHITRVKIIKNNLFFKKGEPLRPFLMADNERYLRQLLYVRDADFRIDRIAPGSDSIDVIVEVKDVFSMGGAINSFETTMSDIEFREDNFAGSGNAAVVYGLYDADRKNKVALGGEYINRNMGGSFIDGTVGYQSFYKALRGPKEDNNYYVNLVKPLINRYMKWTYELDASYHATRNMYSSSDSIYFSDIRYRYYNVEAWAGYNINSQDFTVTEESKKLRKLIGVRYVTQKFNVVPGKYQSEYNWQYADLMGVLATLTFYRQNFYKTQYIYGFGRNEDIPEGLLLSFTSGFTIKQNKSRPFIGFNYERYHRSPEDNYLGYIIRGEGYLNNKSIEDINLLGSVMYINHLKSIGTKWKQRLFLNLDLAQQVNTVLNEPLFVSSSFGLPEYGRNDIVGGTMRTTFKAESEFFSPWSLVSFRFAPFVFSNVGLFSPYRSDLKVLTSVGGGIRTRNESLVFGTIELKGFYFPQKNFYDDHFRLSLSTNIIFKYNTQFVKKPDFIQVN
ncbi:MAG: hypothetical protein ABI237_19195 [Ginsengibacter sp.]